MTDLIVFEYDGEQVSFDAQARMWNLNAMHQAAGGDQSKAPRFWLRQQQTQEFVAALAEQETVILDHSFVETREGRNGGTWAHWQIAAAYAHYLSPRFYLQWNRWAMERQQQLAGAVPSAPVSDLAALEARLTRVERHLGLAARAPRQFAPVPLRERLTAEHIAILAIVAYSGQHGMTTRQLMTACGVTRQRPGMFFRRLYDLREAGYVFKADYKTAPNRITDAGRDLLADHQR